LVDAQAYPPYGCCAVILMMIRLGAVGLRRSYLAAKPTYGCCGSK